MTKFQSHRVATLIPPLAPSSLSNVLSFPATTSIQVLPQSISMACIHLLFLFLVCVWCISMIAWEFLGPQSGQVVLEFTGERWIQGEASPISEFCESESERPISDELWGPTSGAGSGTCLPLLRSHLANCGRGNVYSFLKYCSSWTKK